MAAPSPARAVLVHGASGGVGLAVVQFARAAGLKVAGTAGSEAGRALLRSHGDVQAFDHRDPRHLAAAVDATGGKGFDVIIELLANVNLGDDLTALAMHGRVVVVGSRGTVTVDPRDLMNVEGAVLGMLSFHASPEEVTETRVAIAAGLKDGSLHPVVARESRSGTRRAPTATSWRGRRSASSCWCPDRAGAAARGRWHWAQERGARSARASHA